MLSNCNSVKMKLLAVMGISLGLLGCAKTQEEYYNMRTFDSARFALDKEKYSEPTRFLYQFTHVRPRGKFDNLDNWLVEIDNEQFFQKKDPEVVELNVVSTTIAVGAIVAASFGLGSGTDAAALFFAGDGGPSSEKIYSSIFQSQMLFTVAPFDSNQDRHEQSIKVNNIAIDSVEKALGSKSKSYDGESYGYLLFDSTITESPEDTSCNYAYEATGCFAKTDKIPFVVINNKDFVPLLPANTEVIVALTYLPLGFPIDKLGSPEDPAVEQLLYVPPVQLLKNELFWSKENLPNIQHWAELSRISLNPYIKRMSDGATLYFNSKVEALN